MTHVTLGFVLDTVLLSISVSWEKREVAIALIDEAMVGRIQLRNLQSMVGKINRMRFVVLGDKYLKKRLYEGLAFAKVIDSENRSDDG